MGINILQDFQLDLSLNVFIAAQLNKIQFVFFRYFIVLGEFEQSLLRGVEKKSGNNQKGYENQLIIEIKSRYEFKFSHS